MCVSTWSGCYSHYYDFVALGALWVDFEVFQLPPDTWLHVLTQTSSRDKRAVWLSHCRDTVTGLQVNSIRSNTSRYWVTVHMLRHLCPKKTTVPTFTISPFYGRIQRSYAWMIVTCDQYAAEAQEGELTGWVKIKLHTGDELNVDTEPLSHMLPFYTHAPPPAYSGLGFPNQEIPYGSL